MRQQHRYHRHPADPHHPPSADGPGSGDRLTQTAETIVALATPVGEAGLGVVRLSGPLALAIAGRLFSKDLESAPSHTLHHGWVNRRGERLDEVVVALFRSPTSFTGDDVVEFSCHGSPAVLRELIRWCQAEGARLARPGEFTERAYLNGKIDLAQAEAVASLIAARSSAAARVAVNQLSGGLSRLVTALRGRAISLIAEIEANLDFVEEDIPNVSRERMQSGIAGLLADLHELLSTAGRGRVLRDGIRVALAGRPNVGKSSLFNALLAEDRAIVSDVPGTTRDVIEATIEWSGQAVTLLDTAGLRETRDPVEAIGTDRARRAHASADVTILVVDASQGVTADDEAIATGLQGPFLVALNKADQVRSGPDASRLHGAVVVSTSAVKRTGLEDLRSAVMMALPEIGNAAESATVITVERHAARLAAAERSLRDALQALESGASEETISSDLKSAAADLASITGGDVKVEVLDAIFRQFCIGK